MTDYYDRKKKEVEITAARLKTSPSIARLFKHYKSHVLDCVLDNKPILPLEKFYWEMKGKDLIPTSRIYEKYLRRVFGVETGLDIEDIK